MSEDHRYYAWYEAEIGFRLSEEEVRETLAEAFGQRFREVTFTYDPDGDRVARFSLWLDHKRDAPAVERELRGTDSIVYRGRVTE